MKHPALALILSAALLLPGCAAGPVSVAPVEEGRKSGALKRSVVVPKTGSVSVSFPGLAPRPRTYRTLATQVDIEAVSIYLRDSRTAHSQHLDRQALERPRVDLAFKSVATGPITMRVEAYDDAGTLIGEAEQEARLGSGESLALNLTVALIDSGNVGAAIRFVDGAPSSPPCTPEAAFHQADATHDGFLHGEEYTTAWPFQLAPCDHQGPTPPRAALPFGPNHPGLVEMRRKDRNHDGRISLEEFLARVAPPSHPCLGMFENGDADQDGKLTYDEWLAGNMVPPVPNRPEIFRNHDADGDGFLSARESCGAVTELPLPGFLPVPTPFASAPAIR